MLVKTDNLLIMIIDLLIMIIDLLIMIIDSYNLLWLLINKEIYSKVCRLIFINQTSRLHIKMIENQRNLNVD